MKEIYANNFYTRLVDERIHWWILLSASSIFIDQWDASSIDNLNYPWVFAKLQAILGDKIIQGGGEIIKGDNVTKSGNMSILQFEIMI